jgi:hypothetical protein
MTPSTGSSYALGWPTLRKAAKMLGVNVSTLSRRKIPTQAVGKQYRVSPSVLLAEAAYHGRRPLDEVGHDLIEHTRREAPELVAEVEAEVDAFFESYHPPSIDRGRWLEEARQFLPAELFERVSSVLESPGGDARDQDTEERDAVIAHTS